VTVNFVEPNNLC